MTPAARGQTSTILTYATNLSSHLRMASYVMQDLPYAK